MTMQEAQSEDNEAMKARALQIYERAWSEGRINDLEITFAHTIVRHEPPQPDVVGLDAYKQHILALRAAFPDLTLQVIEAISEGTTQAGRWVFQGTQTGPMPGIDAPPTGKHIEMTGLFFAHTVNDQIVEEWIYGDMMGLFQQLGLLPPMEA
ncbi:MAG: ester cyclase [Chloroflexales bacterium]